MSTSKKTEGVIFDHLKDVRDQDEPNVSFLDNLDAGTLKIVELIMVAGTGQKDIIHQLRATLPDAGDFNAA